MIASMFGHTEVVALLLQHGVDVHAKSKGQRTALTLATDRGCKEVVDLLIKAGAGKDQARQDVTNNNAEPGPSGARSARNESSARMVDFLTKSMKEKESDLECPVCFETAEVPIFMCSEMHLIW